MSFLDFSKYSLKEHIDIICARNNPFGGIELTNNGWRIQYLIDDYIVTHGYEDDKFDIQIYSNEHDKMYSFNSNKYIESYTSPEYNYSKHQTEFTSKNFIINGVEYTQNFYDTEQYKSSTEKMCYNIKIDKSNTMQTLFSKFNFNDPYRDFQIIERKKDDFIYNSQLSIHVSSEHREYIGVYAYIDVIKHNPNSETEVHVEWDHDNKVIFNVDTPDASILHLYNSLNTFQVETALSSTEYYYFKVQLKQLEEILLAYKSEMPIISTVLHNIEVIRSS